MSDVYSPEQDFVDNETTQNDVNVEVNRKVFALEIAVGVKHLVNTPTEFFELVQKIEDYLK